MIMYSLRGVFKYFFVLLQEKGSRDLTDRTLSESKAESLIEAACREKCGQKMKKVWPHLILLERAK